MNTNNNTQRSEKQSTKKRKLVIVISILVAIALIFIGFKYGPTYAYMYKQIQSAKISILNDDLEGALVSYEKAYEEVSQPYLLNEIEKMKQLIESKRSFIKAETFEADKKYDSAYVYYKKVILEDKERYEIAQPKVKQIAEIIVDDIHKQADNLYSSHLYAMVIGRLQTALDYEVKVEETEAKIIEYKALFFDYYCEQALANAQRFIDNDAFYDLFARDLEHAQTYIQTKEQQTTYDELATKLTTEYTTHYLTIAKNAIEQQNLEVAQDYLNRVITIEETNEEAKQLLESIK